MGDEASAPDEARELIARCLAGDPTAIDAFQERFGALIYSYPMRVYRMPAEDAGDFYLYAFDQGRIFRRVRTYAGRTTLRSYLAGFVLDHLVLEWRRGMHELDTVPLDTLREVPDPQPTSHADAGPSLNDILAPIDAAKAVLLKLLFIEDCDLQPDDLQQLSTLSGRPLSSLLPAIDALRARIREREARQQAIEDALDGVQAWIALYERRLRQISDGLDPLGAGGPTIAKLRAEQAELERKVRRRHQQRATLLARAQRRKVTAPYKDIAALLNTSVGTIASQLSRLRRELSANPLLREHLAMLEDRDEG